MSGSGTIRENGPLIEPNPKIHNKETLIDLNTAGNLNELIPDIKTAKNTYNAGVVTLQEVKSDDADELQYDIPLWKITRL